MRFFDLITAKIGLSFKLDEHIPKTYLLNLLISKSIDLIYGIIIFGRFEKCIVSPSATIKCKNRLQFNKKIIIASNCYIDALGEKGIICGEGVSFGRETTMIVSGSLRKLGKGIIIGNNVGLGSHGYYGGAGGVYIGDDTIFGNYVSIHPENHNFENLDKPIRLQGVNHKGIRIGKGCWIGAKATILDGAEIGDGCIVAAGAVVRGKFPPYSIIGGVPAKVIKMRT